MKIIYKVIGFVIYNVTIPSTQQDVSGVWLNLTVTISKTIFSQFLKWKKEAIETLFMEKFK